MQCGDPFLSETYRPLQVPGLSIQAYQKQAVITGSLIIEEDKKYYNRLIWMRPDGSFNHYDKRHLFSLAEEQNTYVAGKHQWIMVWKGRKI